VRNRTHALAATDARDLSYNAITEGPRVARQQRRAFQGPPDLKWELVRGGVRGYRKFITVAWDAQMRLWTMTALEYPVDGNRKQERVRGLVARGGRDRVFVFDDPYGSNASAAKPRCLLTAS